MRLTDKTAVVTGGASGIGAGLCRAFAQEGAQVAVADLRLEAAEELAAEICAAGGRAVAWAMNVAERTTVEQAAGAIAERFGPVDIWVNNAGVSYIVPFLECSDELWDRTLDVNLKGAFIGCQAALRQMLPRKQGVILNMSSVSGKIGATQYAAYCASKFGIIGLTQSLALDFAGDGIRVNAICPGVVMTALWDGQIADYTRKRNMPVSGVRSYLESKVPAGRLCTPEDVARTAVFLASDDAAFITGQAINVSGGIVMH